MKVGIMSDTHGGLSSWKASLEVFNKVDMIIHAGDLFYHGPRNLFPKEYDPASLARLMNELEIPLLISRGNCDADVDQLVIDFPILASYLVLDVGSIRLFVHHGHLFSETEVIKYAKKLHVDLVISGHTHVPSIEKKEDIWFFNPGSPSLPKGTEGPTVGILEGDRLRLLSLPEGKVLKEVKLCG
ncbi:MAG: phosphodiesterase [Synergistetes bacterium]|nr:phosphodiesterase [Synergistota bacterium]